MISTSFITGTGFMKCMPMTRSARLVRAARPVMPMDEVLVARITPGRQARSRSAKICCLTAGLSEAASMAKSTSARSPSEAADL